MSQLEKYRDVADPLADKLLDAWFERREAEQRLPAGSYVPRSSGFTRFHEALHARHEKFPDEPKPFHDFFEQVETVPHWVDLAQLELGSKTYLRCGAMPAVVLGVCCLPISYLSGIGNKALAYLEKMVYNAPRRLRYNGQFFLDICTTEPTAGPDGQFVPHSLLPFGAGWKSVVLTRYKHAQMRRLLKQLVPERARGTTALASNAGNSGGYATAFTIIDPGSGYLVPPPIRLCGERGSGAAAHAAIDRGKLTGIVLDQPGSDYSNFTVEVGPPLRPPWDKSKWGEPINQLYSAGTSLLFSVKVLDHLRQLGFRFCRAEGEAVMHLWRYCNYLLGIEPELCCATEQDGRNLAAKIAALARDAPDDDSRDLIRSLMEQALPAMMEGAMPRLLQWFLGLSSREGRSRFCYGLSYGLLGPVVKDLGYPPTRWRTWARRMFRCKVWWEEFWRRCLPGGTQRAIERGERHLRSRLA